MNVLTSSRAQMPLVERASTVAPASVGGIRDLLRDTALFVATLSTGGTAGDFSALRTRCTSMVADFGAAIDRRGYPEDVRDDAVKAQCALLDEAALKHLSENDKPNWSAQPLQVERFKQHDAGERVFERLEIRMRERSPQVDLLECYAAILGLGFLGRYAIQGESERQKLIGELNSTIERLRPEGEPALVVDHPGRRLADWFLRVSPWAIACIGCVIAFITWFGWHVALDAQLAALIPKTIKP